MKKRIYYWDNLKGLLIILVVLGHYLEYLISEYSSLEYCWTAIYSFHMPAFILTTGYFLGKSSRNPVEKIPKVLGLYILMEILYMIRPILYHKKASLEIGLPRYGCWFLLFLVYGYVLAYFLNKGHDIQIFLVSIIVSLLAGLDSSIGRLWGIGQSIYFMPYLIIGACTPIDRLLKWVRKHRLFCLFGFIIIQLELFAIRDKKWFDRRFFRGTETYADFLSEPYLGVFGRGIAYIVAGLLVLFLLGLISEEKTFLSVVGQHTLVIYLVHTFVLKNIYPELERFEIMNIFFRLIIVTAIVIFICLTLIKYENVKTEHRKNEIK